MSMSFRPIGGNWPLVMMASLAVLSVTIYAYRLKLRGTSGRWRWVAFGLRLAAVILCLLAALRPSVMIDEKQKQNSRVILLIDSSASMTVNDEVGSQTRWSVARKAIEEARKTLEGKSKELEVRSYRFDSDLKDYKADDVKEPTGKETNLGTAMLKAVADAQGVRVAMMVVVADGASNGGTSPLQAAQELQAKGIPVVTVGVGTADAGKGSKDLAAKDLIAGPTVFVKNRPEIRSTIAARGFAGQSVEVDLFVEGETRPVESKTIKIPEGADVVPITGWKYIPDTPGEKRLTIKVRKQPGELVASNNEISTYLDVLKGGLKVLYLQGPDFSWDPKFVTKNLDPAREIHVDLKVVREAARGDRGLLEDADFAPGQYDAYILGGLPADHLTRRQSSLLAGAVEKGAGLIMLGGRSSFGAGGWGGTELARVLPVNVGPADGEVEAGDEGVKVVPNALGLENYVLRLAPNPAENARIWANLPPITGYNRLAQLKPAAFVLATAGRDNLIVAMDDVGKGRTLAFGGETWHWARSFEDDGRLAHARFWRQAVLWLARRENKGEEQVKLKLEARRVPVGGKIDLTATARDSKNEPITDAVYEATATRIGPDRKPIGKPEPVPLYPQADGSKGPYFAGGEAGEYLVELKGTRQGKSIGQDQARFMVFQDDRELENPAADLALLKEIARTTGGASLRSEELSKHLKELGPEASEYVQQVETKLWDNWPFFLLFVALLTAEWALRKAKGWV